MTNHRARPTRRRRRLLSYAAVAAVGTILTVTGCGGSPTNDSAAGTAPVNGPPQVLRLGANSSGRTAEQAAKPAPKSPPGVKAAGGSPSGRSDGLQNINLASFGRSQIKTAQIDLRSQRVATLVATIEGIATAQGGFVDSENTATDLHGVAQTSSITLRVPVGNFDTAVTAVAQLGQLASKKTTTVDVTGQVANVDSRVKSAQDSIAQLRVLFDRATKLSDIITLESELSARESDLEALQAQQRALSDQTSLSTISVLVTRPHRPPAKPHHEDTSGFVGGLHQGWNGLVTAFRAVSHALGAAIPLAAVLAVLALLGWVAVRRVPRRHPDTSG
jgi:hypothetical protein